MVNRVRQLQALIDKKKMIITESSIRSDLHLEDAKGTDCLPTTTIFEELAKMGYEKPSQKLTFYKSFFSPQWKFLIHTNTQSLSAKSTAWNEFSSTMASLNICLATNQKFNLSKYIFHAMVKHLDGGVKFLLYPRFLQVFINQQLGDMSHHKEIYVNPSHTKKLFANMKRAGKDFFRRITPLFDTMMVQASEEVGEDSDHPTDSNQIPIVDQPSTSSQPKQKQKSKRKQKKEAKVAHDETEHEERVLDLEKAKFDQAIEIASLKKRVGKLENRRKFRTTGLKRLKKVGAARRIESTNDSLGAQEDASKQGRRIEDIDADAEVTLVNETQERQDEDLMFDTRVLDGDEMFVDATIVTTAGVEDSAALTIPTTVEETLAHTLMEIKAAKPKAKGIVFHDLEKQVSKPTVSVTQASIKDKGKGIMQDPERPLTMKDQVAFDEDLARNIQAQLDAEIIEEERLERTPTKIQNRSQMSTYLKHMGGYKHKQLMGKSYDEIQKLFGKEMKRVNTFVAMSSEAQESNEKKVEESPKRQKLEDDKETDEHKEVKADDTTELKKHLVIKKDDDIAIDVITLATKPPMIIDYKFLKEEIIVHYQLIRADGSSKRHSSMIRLL
ncbi:hypothetical protein Tco_0562029 [Tanacetum coccineum]